VTDRGERYREQLASHSGNRIEVFGEKAGSSLPGSSLASYLWSGTDDILWV
jgi:hypothetical protein